MIILVFVIGVYVIQFLFGAIFLLAYFKKPEKRIEDTISDISVIIPFNNEATRIMPLLNRIPNLSIPSHLSLEFIFVDDHSSDGSSNIISAQKISNSSLIKNQGSGKKQAIRAGVELAKGEFIITWDADTVPQTNYFVEIERLGRADMWILPVRLGGSKLIQKLGAIEFSWLQILGIGLAKFLSPSLCNGANLLIKKTAFLEAESLRNDYHIASGDDMFLLDALKKMEADIRASSNEDLLVEAESPSTFAMLLLQRKRWAGKMNHLKSGFSVFFGLLLIAFVFVGFILTTMTDLGWIIVIPLVMKIVNEYVLLGFEQRGRYLVSNIFVVLLHQIWYPFYLIRLLFPVNQKEKRWTKRNTP